MTDNDTLPTLNSEARTNGDHPPPRRRRRRQVTSEMPLRVSKRARTDQYLESKYGDCYFNDRTKEECRKKKSQYEIDNEDNYYAARASKLLASINGNITRITPQRGSENQPPAAAPPPPPTIQRTARANRYNIMEEAGKKKRTLQENQKFNAALGKFTTEEDGIDKHNWTPKKRKVNTQSFGEVMLCLASIAMPDREPKTKVAAILDSVFELAATYPDTFKDELIVRSRDLIRNESFQSWRLLQEMDKTGGFNGKGIDCIRKRENLKKNERGVLPSAKAIQNRARQLESFVDSKLKLKLVKEVTPHGPVYSLPFDRAVRYILDRYGLTKYALNASGKEDAVVLSFSCDGAAFSRKLGAVSEGMKITDLRAKDPLTGYSISLNGGKWQSRSLCYILRQFFGPETKATYQLYEVLGKHLARYGKGRLCIPAADGLPELNNILTNVPMDKSAVWKATRMGGGLWELGTEWHCPYCSCHRDHVADSKIENERCDLCKRLNRPQCYCWEVIDQESLDKAETEREKYIQQAHMNDHTKLAYIMKNSEIRDDPGSVNKPIDRLHIDFQPDTEEEELDFEDTLMRELKLRVQPSQLQPLMNEDVEEKRSILKGILQDERKIKDTLRTYNRVKAVRDMDEVVFAEIAIPDLLHSGMRTAEKVLNSLINQAIGRYSETTSDVKKRNSLEDLCTKHICEHILGTPESPAQWNDWHWKKKKQGIERIPLGGDESKKAMHGIKSMAALLFSPLLDEEPTQTGSDPEQTIRDKNLGLLHSWTKLIDVYLPMMDLLGKHDNFSADDLDQIHVLTNTFMTLWVKLMGRAGISNYIHDLGSGHLYYFAKKYKNLWRFCQQGWEATNQAWSRYYYHNTNHGGSRGNKSGKMIKGEHLLDIAHLNQRQWAWRTGDAERFFKGENVSTDALYLDDSVDAEPAMDPLLAQAAAAGETEDSTHAML